MKRSQIIQSEACRQFWAGMATLMLSAALVAWLPSTWENAPVIAACQGLIAFFCGFLALAHLAESHRLRKLADDESECETRMAIRPRL